jgi:2-keto-3-deoxy-L-rhamnonate aldolase RhmA
VSTQLGFFSVTGHPLIAEMYGVLGADFVVIDMEAAPIDKAGTLVCVQALTGTSARCLVRVPWLERHWIEHALDIGADGVIVPKIDTAEDAARAVAAAYFRPRGRRGLNPVRASSFFTEFDTYVRTVNDRTDCLVQIESTEGVGNVAEIAAVPGLSGLFIGSGDLVADLGHPGNMNCPGMAEARAAVLAACAAHDLVPGIFAYSLELARKYVTEGFRFVAIGNEIKMLAAETVRSLDFVREVRSPE